MEFTETLKNNYEFRRLYSRGACAAVPCLAVYARKTRRSANRLGITVSTKVGKAVVRNRIRRRLREIYRLNENKLVRGAELVIVARQRAATAGYSELEQSFLRACARLGLLTEEARE